MIVISVADGTTEFLCMPHFVETAAQVLTAITHPDDDDVMHAVANAGVADQVPMTGGGVKPPGHNAPATSDDDDLLAAYDSRITVDELPAEFR